MWCQLAQSLGFARISRNDANTTLTCACACVRRCRDGVGTAHLSRAIKEAAAAGVKVGEARRLLKLMQGLDNTVALFASVDIKPKVRDGGPFMLLTVNVEECRS